MAPTKFTERAVEDICGGISFETVNLLVPCDRLTFLTFVNPLV